MDHEVGLRVIFVITEKIPIQEFFSVTLFGSQLDHSIKSFLITTLFFRQKRIILKHRWWCRNDLKTINQRLKLRYLPASMNSTTTPGDDWVFSESAELVDWPVSHLFREKVIPKAKSLRSALDQDAEFKAKYMEVFQHDYALMDWLESRRQSKQ